MNPDDGYYGYTEGELRVTTGADGTVGVQLEQTTKPRPKRKVSPWRAWDRTQPVAESVVKHVVRMYRDARTMKQIGAQTGYSPTNIYRILKKAGEPTRPQGTKGTGRCVDCDAKCGMNKRCKIHRKVRYAELNLEAVYRMRGKRKKRGEQ